MPDITQSNEPSTKLDMSQVSDTFPMSGSHTLVPTEYASYMGDITVAGLIGKIQTATGIEYGSWPYPFTATTNSSGVATAYLTNDGMSTGSVAFPTKVYNASASPIGIGAANYNVTNITVSSDRKSIAITLNQVKSVLGLLSFNATADAGVVVQGTIWGK